ncbi:hypothetical protein BCR37DRAFT_388473 [Protomyces lactucae-debilis]|uniref:Uncharacterized protein n=1 Tax=Protomyces lactucae-debilis TaxID=2754530 RepID=A0A1Y2F7W6_PROLT|nr:uncharacterized protein BCR37DRAFT_388473 [Protomyces lactucae-debilis]ORY79456.1 hypothetical protein BCR37DRAFT_388473 [Protomyces lactucae-debilis]
MSTDTLNHVGHLHEATLLSSPYQALNRSSPRSITPQQQQQPDWHLAIDTSIGATAPEIHSTELSRSSSGIKTKLGKLLRRVSIKSPASPQPPRELDAAPLQRLTSTDSDTVDTPKPHLVVRNSIDLARAKLRAMAKLKAAGKRGSAQSSASTLSTADSQMTTMIYEAGGTQGVRASVLEAQEEGMTPVRGRSHSVRFKEMERRKRVSSMEGEQEMVDCGQGACELLPALMTAQNTPAGQAVTVHRSEM